MSDSAVIDTLSRAVERHRSGALTEAESLYRRILTENPDQPDALHLLGLVALTSGREDEALRLIRRAVALVPSNADFRFSLGNAEHTLGQLEEAAQSYRSAIALAPALEGAHNNLGLTLRDLGQPEAALEALARACELAPQAPESWNNRGMVLKELGRLDEAERAVRHALALAPQFAEAHNELAGILAKQGRTEEAVAAYRAAIALVPDYAEAHDNLGAALLNSVRETNERVGIEDALSHFRKALEIAPDRWSAWENMGNALTRLDRFEDAVEAYGRGAAILRRPGGGFDRHSTFRRTSPAKLAHDIEQIRYLMALGRLGADGMRLLSAYETALAKLPPPAPGTHIVEMPPEIRRLIGGTYNRLWHRADAPEVAGGAVNPALDRAAVEADYFGRAPGITWLDGLLAPQALSSLRRFCLESTVWFDCSYPQGYVGAFAEDGFICPLLLQIGRELPQRLPGIFGAHKLRKVWAFKYGDNLEGIAPHADFAAVNVNFWITPDDANLDPASGGLVLWDKEAPPEWDFATYNENQKAMGQFLRESGAKSYTVPHRCNRGVIFNSDLIHRTDDIHFKPGYENRRINVTFLYGVREGRL